MATERNEDYLEAIEHIVRERGYARVKDVSETLNVGISSVTEMLQKMAGAGYVNYEKYGGVTLTKKGGGIARETRKKHLMLRELLIILGIDEKTADEDACRMEHILNRETLDRMTKFVGFVQKSEKSPRWLDHFNYYYETGKYVECTPRNSKNCPVHGKGKQVSAVKAMPSV